MKREFLLIGYGSAGKRHARNLLEIGIKPYILTRHPDNLAANFINDIAALKGKDIRYCFISSVTARHLDDLAKCAKILQSLKDVLIEKPLEYSSLRAEKIREIAARYKLNIWVAYNLRFMPVFGFIHKFVQGLKNKIRIVEVAAGQDLREWRPGRELSRSYSARRNAGGGVDLDLSHEIDYVLWLFGNKFKKKILYRDKISGLKIKSPDILKLVLVYKRFIADITLDYIRRPKERYLKIICEGGRNFYCDFTRRKSEIDNSYKSMLRAFLGLNRAARKKLCSLEEALNVLKVLGV